MFMRRILEWTRPSKPSSIPGTSYPNPTEVLTVARITAFKAGQSPPPVRIPTRIDVLLSRAEIVLEKYALFEVISFRLVDGG